MKIFIVKVDLDWGMRGVRRIRKYYFSKRPIVSSLTKKLDVDPQAISITSIDLDSYNYENGQSVHGI